MDWESDVIADASDAKGLAAARGYVTDGIEAEFTNRFDLVGPKALAYQGRAGPSRFARRQVARGPPCKRVAKRPVTLAWRTAAKWMGHLGRGRARLRELVRRSQMADLSAGFSPMQRTAFLNALFEVNSYLANVLRSRVTLSTLPSLSSSQGWTF